MNERFWNLWTNDYPTNCAKWQRHPANPVLPPEGNGWKKTWTANPDFLDFNGRLLVYYRGTGSMPNDAEERDRMGVAEVLGIGAGKFEFRDLNDGQPIVAGPSPEAFDADLLDPAAVVFKDEVFLYYSALGPNGDSIGLARSSDGVSFDKVGRVMAGRAPEVVLKDGRLYLITQEKTATGGYELFLFVSDDGIKFDLAHEGPIFSPQPGQWDGFSVVTARVFSGDDGWFTMMYGGSPDLADEPEYFGIARSRDLTTWERHPGNPIFGCGPKGSPDGGLIWLPALYEAEDAYVLLYEGSRGKPAWDLWCSVCMAYVGKGQG
jgi:predicted GH43/DUF377 family glycosyl hydrolase